MTAHGDAGDQPTMLLNRYRVEATLGHGGFSTVLRAYDIRIKRLVAIKALKPALSADPDRFRALEERFTREAEASSRMGIHPNIVAVYDLATDADGTHYLILEYVAGGTLAERITSGPLPLTDALRITGDAARGLHAAHQTGIVHRDVKPANIFLAANGRAQVGDFGIAQIDDLSHRTQMGTGHPGTPLYMSPEQERQTVYLRPSSDQFSLGLVLFEMLAGTGYKRLEPREAAYAMDRLPPAVAALIRRMTETESSDRYPTMAEVITAIDALPTSPRDDVPTIVPASIIFTPSSPSSPPSLPLPPGSFVPPTFANVQSSQTPRVDLQPIAPIERPVESQPTSAPQRFSRRAVLIGLGGLVVVGGGAGVLAYATHGSGAAPTTPPPTRVPPNATDTVAIGTRLRVVTEAAIRATPEVNGKVVIPLRVGEFVTTRGAAVYDAAASKWYPVTAPNGMMGYIRAEFVAA